MKLRSNTITGDQRSSSQRTSQVTSTLLDIHNDDAPEDVIMPSLDSSHPIIDDSLLEPMRTSIDASPQRNTRRLLSSILDSPRRTLRKTRNTGKRPCLRLNPDLNAQAQSDLGTNEFTDSLDLDMKTSVKSQQCQPIERRPRNVLTWIHDEAPTDLIPKILSYAGPQKIAMLSTLNKSWRRLCLNEPVWKTLCEDYGKWVPEKDPLPLESNMSDSMEMQCPSDDGLAGLMWHKYYCDHPIVPIDFKTVKAALRSVSSIEASSNPSSGEDSQTMVQKRNVRILLHPGRHIISRQLLIQAKNNSVVSFETLSLNRFGVDANMTLPQCASAFPSTACMACSIRTDASHLALTSPPASPSRIRDTIRNFLICRSAVDIAFEASCVDMDVFSAPPLRHGRATIILHTSSVNEPVVRVQEGTFHLCQVDLVHSCQGTDIWNGNAALQVQPAVDHNHNSVRVAPPDLLPPTAIIEDADIMSLSGRGIVAIDGAKSMIRNCFIHDCAATGIYVGGLGSSASIDHTDITHNGNGNRRSRRGIGRGHSGVYLEQGVVNLMDCNVSQNSLTGISAVSHHNATIVVENSDLQGNGTLQLELPPTGTQSRGRCVSKNNLISPQGSGRRRSSITPESLLHASFVPSSDYAPPRPPTETMGPHVVYPRMYVEM